jgi:hypothetical protein
MITQLCKNTKNHLIVYFSVILVAWLVDYISDPNGETAFQGSYKKVSPTQPVLYSCIPE